MRMRHLFFLLLILTQSACGQKGPLYLPQDEPLTQPPSAQENTDKPQEKQQQADE